MYNVHVNDNEVILKNTQKLMVNFRGLALTLKLTINQNKEAIVKTAK